MSLAPTAAAPFATLILPVYEASGFIEATLRETRAWLAARPEPWELIVVDDASRDGTGAALERFARLHVSDAIRVVRFDTNHGKGFAVRVGLDRARGRFAVFTDCDLAYPLDNIDRIVDRLAAGADAATACRVAPGSTYLIAPGFFSYLFTRHLMGRLFNAVCRAFVTPRLRDTQAGLKGFRTDAVRPLLPLLRLDGFSFDVEILRGLLDRGARIDEVPVAFRYDSEPSTVNFARDALRMLRDLALTRARSLLGRYRGDRPIRGLIIHADDYGLSPGVNRAIEEGLVSRAVSSASLLLGGAYAEPALWWAGAHPEFDFGVHLNLTQGRPVLPTERVPSLVGAGGRFAPLGRLAVRMLAGRIAASEVAAEWRAQIAAVRAAGVRISHIDSHQHVHLLPPTFRGIAARLAAEEGLALRTMDGTRLARAFRGDFKGVALALASRFGARKPSARAAGRVEGTGTLLRDRSTLARLDASLRTRRPDGTVELVVHPGFADAALAASGDGYVEGRAAERAFLVSEDARAWMHVRGFRLTDFRGERAAHPWSGQGPREDAEMTQLTARIVLAAALGAGMHAVAKDCPQAVVSAAEKAHPGAKIAACREERESGATTFQVKVATPDAKKLEMDIGPDSAILKTEEGMAPGALPDAVARGVAAKFPGAKLADVEKQTAPNGDVTYEIECRTGGGRRVVVFDATGGFVREEHDDD